MANILFPQMERQNVAFPATHEADEGAVVLDMNPPLIFCKWCRKYVPEDEFSAECPRDAWSLNKPTETT